MFSNKEAPVLHVRKVSFHGERAVAGWSDGSRSRTKCSAQQMLHTCTVFSCRNCRSSSASEIHVGSVSDIRDRNVRAPV